MVRIRATTTVGEFKDYLCLLDAGLVRSRLMLQQGVECEDPPCGAPALLHRVRPVYKTPDSIEFIMRHLMAQ